LLMKASTTCFARKSNRVDRGHSKPSKEIQNKRSVARMEVHFGKLVDHFEGKGATCELEEGAQVEWNEKRKLTHPVHKGTSGGERNGQFKRYREWPGGISGHPGGRGVG